MKIGIIVGALLFCICCRNGLADTPATNGLTQSALESATLTSYGDTCPPTCGADTGGVLVKYSSASIKREWKIADYELDPYNNTQKNPMILNVGAHKYLLAFVWTGGNHCCWPVLIFNVSAGKYLGEFIDSNTAIQIQPNENECDVVLRGRPFDNSVSVSKTATESEIDEAMPFHDYCFRSGTLKILRTVYPKPNST